MLIFRVPILVDFEKLEEKKQREEYPASKTIEYVENMSDPRFIKTHLPWTLLPHQIQNLSKKPKV